MIGSIFKLIGGVKPLTLAIGFALVTLCGLYTWEVIQNRSLQRTLDECLMQQRILESDVAVHHAKVSELLAAVAEQNAEVRRISKYADDIALQNAEAELQFIEARAKRKVDITALKESIGTSCLEGISLIDQELKL